ncbi:hypothetical protein MXM82_11030 [Pseudomonas asiatica]|uniref:hypothetical protein n=1 Tax=Pseudomonas asiatica TaxID=2219225 RepID=UPI002DBADF4F|nr:hypothetical protein [Pseudomonas asiatica]MEB6589662.1 hypothetical protein [Pseudomonas asiatica]
MSNHTPGPWTARPIPNTGLSGHIGYAIDFNEDQEQVVDFVYEEADARLIAVAPDLLSIVQRFVALDAQWNPDRHASEKSELMEEARAAIDKARAKP